MQKTVRNAVNLCAKNTAKCVTFLHMNLAHFQCFLQEIVWQFSIFFKLFRDDFYGMCAGMGKAGSRSNPGVNVAIPIGIALVKIVSAARNQRKAKLARKLENTVSDVTGGGGGE